MDILNNTAYGNGTVVGYPDIFANTCTDVNILNNIMYARTGGSCNANNRNVNVVYDYNIYFNGKIAVQGSHDIIADPQFVTLSTDLATGNFRLKPTSPAIDKGSAAIGQFSRTDILGISRPQGIGPDMGAYEFQNQAIITAITEPIATDITIMPNPVENVATIKWAVMSGGAKGRVEVANCWGQVVLQTALSGETTELNTEKLASGLYLLLIYRDDKLLSVSKFVKQ